jgi:hypothetical protein
MLADHQPAPGEAVLITWYSMSASPVLALIWELPKPDRAYVQKAWWWLLFGL